MLLLSRKSQQTILIDDGRIVLRVLSVGRKNIVLGITAPRDVKVVRGELEAKQGRQAA